MMLPGIAHIPSPILRALGAAILVLTAFPASGSGQVTGLDRFSLEPRVGVAFPTGDYGDVDPGCPSGASGCAFPLQIGAEAGWRWEIRVHYALSPRWSLVAGAGKSQLGCSGPFCGGAPAPEANGGTLGMRGNILPVGSMRLWAEAGVALEEFSIIRTRTPVGDPTARRVRYPRSLGFYAGGGADLALTGRENLFFTPGFRFRQVVADPPSGQSDLKRVAATLLVAEIGFRVALGS